MSIHSAKNYTNSFIELCSKYDFARSLLYVDVPRYYTWNATRREWKRRVKGSSVHNWPSVKSRGALGRVYMTHVSNMEFFCLRMLLHHVREPTSFEDLKKHNNQVFLTYREICEARGFLENINNWDLTLEEAAQCRLAVEMRKIFAILKATCGLSNRQLSNIFPTVEGKI